MRVIRYDGVTRLAVTLMVAMGFTLYAVFKKRGWL